MYPQSLIDPSTAQLRYLTDLLLENGTEVFVAWERRKCPPPLKTRDGVVIFHHWPQDPVFLLFREIFLLQCYIGNGFYQPRASDIVLDLGANIGMFAMHLLGLCKDLTIHCFEPSQTTRERLKFNVKSNSLDKNISVHPFAVWNQSDRQVLLPYACSGRRSFFNDGRECEDGPGELVQCVTLPAAIQMCSVETIDLLKIDTEGAEVEILDAVDDATWAKIRRITLEYHEELRPGSKTHLIKLLKKIGFHHVVIRPHNDDAIGIIQASRLEIG